MTWVGRLCILVVVLLWMGYKCTIDDASRDYFALHSARSTPTHTNYIVIRIEIIIIILNL